MREVVHMADERAELLGVGEFARLAGVSESLTWRAVKSGDLKTVRLNSRVLIPRSELDDLIAKAS